MNRENWMAWKFWLALLAYSEKKRNKMLLAEAPRMLCSILLQFLEFIKEIADGVKAYWQSDMHKQPFRVFWTVGVLQDEGKWLAVCLQDKDNCASLHSLRARLLYLDLYLTVPSRVPEIQTILCLKTYFCLPKKTCARWEPIFHSFYKLWNLITVKYIDPCGRTAIWWAVAWREAFEHPKGDTSTLQQINVSSLQIFLCRR